MAHHSDKPINVNLENLFRKGIKPQKEIDKVIGDKVIQTGIGATGKFPEGKLVKHDEGEIRMAVGNKDGKIVIEFGTSVKWIGMTKEQALALANSLIDHSK